jgi:hypothetical protein
MVLKLHNVLLSTLVYKLFQTLLATHKHTYLMLGIIITIIIKLLIFSNILFYQLQKIISKSMKKI